MSNDALCQIEQQRDNMIFGQIRTQNVHRHDILNTLATVQREKFVPSQFQSYAFAEDRIALGPNQWMLYPVVEGRILEETSPSKEDDVLIIGAGSGYLAACFAHLTKTVVGIDKYEAHTKQATANAEHLGLSNLRFMTQDVSVASIDTKQNYSLIVFTGSFKTLPSLFAEMLSEQGRIFVFEGQTENLVSAVLYTKKQGSLTLERHSIFETSLERMEGFEDEEIFVF